MGKFKKLTKFLFVGIKVLSEIAEIGFKVTVTAIIGAFTCAGALDYLESKERKIKRH